MRYTIISNPANLDESLEEALGLIAAEAFLNRDDGQTRFTRLISSAAINVQARVYTDWSEGRHRENHSDNLRKIIDWASGLIAACLDRSSDFPHEVVTLAQASDIVFDLANADK